MRTSGRRLARRSLRHRPGTTMAVAVVALAAASVVIGAVALSVVRDDLLGLELLGALAVCIAAGSATAAGTVVVRRGVGTTQFVALLSLGLGIFCVGAAVRFAEIVGTGTDETGLHDGLFLLAGTIVLFAALRHPDLGPRRRRLRTLVDAAISGLSVAVLLWLVAGRALWERGDPSFDTVAAVLTVAVAFAITRVCITIVLTRQEDTPAESAAALVTLGFAALALGGLLHLFEHALDLSAWVMVLSDVAAVIGLSMIGVAGVMMLGDPRPFPVRLVRRRLRSLVDLTPILVSAAATVAVLVDAAARGEFDTTASAVLTVVVSAVLLRQSLTLSDNRQLSSSLRTTVDGLEQQATHDALTGLPNRAGLADRITAAAHEAATSGTVCAVYFVDVDHLKTVNDSLGHHGGDLLIRATADRLSHRVGDRVTRFGGDEFVLVVQDLDSPSGAEALGRLVVEDMGRPIALDGHQVRSSSSVGVALADTTTSPEELLRRADVALYRAKSRGRRCLAVYDPDDDPGTGDDLDLEPQLRRGVAGGEFTLHYQPIIDLHTGHAASVESLLRWQHPERGVLGPDAFLEAAISSGLLGAIGESSLRRACEDFASMDPSRVPHELPSVSVNLSSSELADQRVVERVAAALSGSGLPPVRLTVEITEDVIVDEAVRATIDQLCALGVHLAIDDFGTGNSSLRQLGAYPADVLKIDKSFVDRLEDDPRAVAITTTIVRLARDLGLTTVAEGVETAGQAEVLTRIGCDRAQGWLFARAMPFDELVEWCATQLPTRRYGDRRESVASASSMMRASRSATGGRSSIAPTT